jgi:hypothetical protein
MMLSLEMVKAIISTMLRMGMGKPGRGEKRRVDDFDDESLMMKWSALRRRCRIFRMMMMNANANVQSNYSGTEANHQQLSNVACETQLTQI